MKELERTLKALANRRRLQILQELKKKHLSVGGLAASIHLSFHATSKHLRILTAASIVDPERRGMQVYYALTHILSPIVKRTLDFL